MIYTAAGLWVDTTEVTHDGYYSVMKANPSYYNRSNCGQCPIENITATEAMLYANARTKAEQGSTDTVYSYSGITWGSPPSYSSSLKTTEAQALTHLVINSNSKGYRLPTAAEWGTLEKGGKAVNFVYWEAYYTDAYAAMDSSVLYAWYKVNAAGTPQIVAQKIPNDFGLYDMVGNVEEYTSTLNAQGTSYISKGVAADATLGAVVMMMAAQSQWLTGVRLVRNP